MSSWLTVTYNIAASVVTPHPALERPIAAARRANPERRQASRVGLEGDGWRSGHKGSNGLRFLEALGLGGVHIPPAAVGRAGLRHLVSPIGASDLVLVMRSCQ